MESRAKFTFKGESIDDAVRARASARVRELEKKFGRIIACHVEVRSPSRHRQAGSPVGVKIRLLLPNDRVVNVNRAPAADERHSNMSFALNDAFNRARRALQDQVRIMQGVVKTSRAATRRRALAG